MRFRLPIRRNTETLSYTTTQSQSVATAQAYNGDSAATAFTTNETDTLSGGLQTTTTTSTEYYSFGSGGVGPVHDLGGTMSTTGETVTTLIGPNNGLIDVLPEAQGTPARRRRCDADAYRNRRRRRRFHAHDPQPTAPIRKTTRSPIRRSTARR